MNPNIQIFSYQENAIEFDFAPKKLMVNATEMGKIFGKLPKDFLKTDETKAFILECLKKDNYPFLNAEKEEDLHIAKQKSGTWMHRVLALKFAAWLNPAFELWVYRTIEEILFGTTKERTQIFTEKTKLKAEKEALEREWRQSENFKRIAEIESEIAQWNKKAREQDKKLSAIALELFNERNEN